MKRCEECGGELEKREDFYQCKRCKRVHRPCEVYSRVVGYIRPVEQWNDGKQTEYRDRWLYGTRNFG